MEEAVVYFDASIQPKNPGGICCSGWVIAALPIETDKPLTGGRLLFQGEGATNNKGEFNAALDALRAVYATGWRGCVRLRGDSQLVIRQARGEWRCRQSELQPLLKQLRFAFTFFDSVILEWIPREENREADEQSRIPYLRAIGA